MVDAPDKIWTVLGNHGLLAFRDDRPNSVEYTRSDLVAELVAENERLTKHRDDLQNRHDSLGFALDGIKARAEAFSRTGEVNVKALEWSDVRQPDEEIRYHHIIAESPIGQWTIQWKGWKEYDDRTVFLDGDFVLNGGDLLEAAKAAAQADYEQRILSALVFHPRATNTVDDHETTNVSDKPEGQQPVTWLTNLGWIDSPSYTVSFEGDKSGCENFPVYTRPSEQVVTEAMVLAAWNRADKMHPYTYLQNMSALREVLKAAMEAGR